MDLSPIITRLKASNIGLKKVGDSADLDAALRATATPSPSAFLILNGETNSDEDADFDSIALEVTFSVVLALSNKRDAKGSAATLDLSVIRPKVIKALVGWIPDADSGYPIEYSSGRILRFEDGVIWWGDEYKVRREFLLE
jgi:hypothetical protein